MEVHRPSMPGSLRVHQWVGFAPGPRLIVLGAVHGNETCGTQAIGRLLGEFDDGTLRLARGVLTLVPVTNPLAYRLGRRQGDRNLNRNLRITREPMDFEDRVANALCPLLQAHDVLLDLHSFHTLGTQDRALFPCAGRRGDGAATRRRALRRRLARYVCAGRERPAGARF